MKRWLLGVAVAVLGAVIAVPEADAKRVGGARSSGAQRSATNAPPASAPAQPAQPGQVSQMNSSSAAKAAPAATPPAAAPQPASGLARWAPMLGGLALGGLLGSMFGGGAFGGVMLAVLMIGMLVLAAVVVMRLLAQRNAQQQRPLQYAGAGLGNETVAAPPPSQMAGFDRGASAASPAPARSLPAGFDADGFARGAKMNFLKLQMANDTGNLDEIREFTSPEMFAELSRDVASRSGAVQHTEVVALNADVLEVVTEGGSHWASVRFSGTVREAPGEAPQPFEEIWNLSKPVDGSAGWVLAGIQQMH